MNNLFELKDSFKEEVLEEDKLVLVDFWAPWCKYCSILKPVLQSIIQKDEFKNNLKVVTVNIDKYPYLAQQFEIMSIPHLLLFKNGRKVDLEITQREEDELEELIRDHIKE